MSLYTCDGRLINLYKINEKFEDTDYDINNSNRSSNAITTCEDLITVKACDKPIVMGASTSSKLNQPYEVESMGNVNIDDFPETMNLCFSGTCINRMDLERKLYQEYGFRLIENNNMVELDKLIKLGRFNPNIPNKNGKMAIDVARGLNYQILFLYYLNKHNQHNQHF
jgi:hypothetical protein